MKPARTKPSARIRSRVSPGMGAHAASDSHDNSQADLAAAWAEVPDMGSSPLLEGRGRGFGRCSTLLRVRAADQ